MRIVFMGTPDFALPSLQAILNQSFDVVAVITAPDRKGGRGKKQLIESPVKKFAKKTGIPILQPRNLKDEDFVEELSQLNTDLQVVVAFRMLPQIVWDMPPLGTVNLHASLLPDYRGAAPIHWAIINGEKETGVTTFQLKHKIDTGDIIDQRRVPIQWEDNVGTMHDKLMHTGAELLVESITKIKNGTVEYQPQDNALETKKAPKIFFEDCRIHFDHPVTEVYNFIRGLSPFPTAWLRLDGKVLKVLSARVDDFDQVGTPGKIYTDAKNQCSIQCNPGCIQLLEVQMEGKKKMKTEDWLRGYQIRSTKVDQNTNS